MADSGAVEIAAESRTRPASRRAWPRVVALFSILGTSDAVGQAPPGAGPADPEPRGPGIGFVEHFSFDGRVSEWRARPVDQVLEAVGATPQALLWVGQTDEGLAVAIELRDAERLSDVPALIVSLAGARDPDFPPVGWGHQFGHEVLADSTACDALPEAVDACASWYRRQLDHRDRLTALFERSWRFDIREDARPTELRAGPAFAALPAADRLAPLAPGGRVRAASREILGTDGGVGAELLIPWSAFPPVRAQDLEAVRIAVAWEDRALRGTARASTRPSFEAARPLARPLAHHVTPCRSGLRGMLVPGGDDRRPRTASEGAVPYMIPDPSGDLRRLIILDNPVAGYQYTPDSESLSPEAFEARFDVLDVGGGVRLCTPFLTLASEARRLSPPDWTNTGEGDPWERFADLRDLEIRPLDDGTMLALSGPRVFWSYYGSGQCGACPRVSVEVFHLDPGSGEISPVLRHFDLAEPDSRDIEIAVSPDWREVTVFRSETLWQTDPIETRWSSIRYCQLSAPQGPPAYEVCAEEEDVPEPDIDLRARYREP